MPIGGQDELGKSMYCVEVNGNIFVIDAGYRFPDSDKLGVDIMIPSFQYLKDNNDRVSAIIITHGHNDVMGALPYLLKEVQGVPVYAPTLTSELIEQMIDHYERHNNVQLHMDLHRVRRNASINVNGITVEFFPVTHSIPGSVGVAIDTPDGYIVYSSEFIIDFGAPEGFRSDIQKMIEIGKKGVLALLVESSYAKKNGYTSPLHKLTNLIEPVFEDAQGRMIVCSFGQNIFRTKELVELTNKYNRKIVFYGREKYDKTNAIIRIDTNERHAIIEVDEAHLGDKDSIGKNDDDYVILLNGSPDKIYNHICDILDGGDELLNFKKGDTVVVCSPVLPGIEMIANRAINDLYRTDAHIVVFKNKNLYSMHASVEDLKVLYQVFSPKYYLPIKGEYQHLFANALIAEDMGVPTDNIVILDNGEMIGFLDGELQTEKAFVEVDDTMIDGSGVGDVGDKVIDDRIRLSNDGVVIIGLTIDAQTRHIIATTDCQTRGFIYLKDYGYVVREIIEICEGIIEEMQYDHTLSIADARNMMREQSLRYIRQETGKRPVFIAVIIEV
ncbi:MAG: ribonuclease J [Erysipelotrichaceae bacterium]|nr:ribonuclease J [Erysipelotrichaceae bacterium]